ncbi:MAG: type II toxin-antitoxin system death-on-curing family toxin [Nitrospirae bacterium]|jgi:death on curing protein|nr:type II toxin-antitoxin system death-on-curing family toxin [Nitrospirota bacterium]
MIKKVTVKEVEHITFKMAQELLSFNEPIPNFSTRPPNILESCLAAPFQTFGGKFLYPGFLTRASMLFYLMIKNHPFENGNKRIAMTTLLTFLFANKKWLIADTQELYNLTVWIAQSPSQFKDEVVKALEKFLKTHIKEIY